MDSLQKRIDELERRHHVADAPALPMVEINALAGVLMKRLNRADLRALQKGQPMSEQGQALLTEIAHNYFESSPDNSANHAGVWEHVRSILGQTEN